MKAADGLRVRPTDESRTARLTDDVLKADEDRTVRWRDVVRREAADGRDARRVVEEVRKADDWEIRRAVKLARKAWQMPLSCALSDAGESARASPRKVRRNRKPGQALSDRMVPRSPSAEFVVACGEQRTPNNDTDYRPDQRTQITEAAR